MTVSLGNIDYVNPTEASLWDCSIEIVVSPRPLVNQPPRAQEEHGSRYLHYPVFAARTPSLIQGEYPDFGA